LQPNACCNACAELEGNILKLLSDASGDILEDEVLIKTLSQVYSNTTIFVMAFCRSAPRGTPKLRCVTHWQSKVASEDVASALKQAAVTEDRINNTRTLYVDNDISTVFLC
jgi:hypothetical protein